MVRDATLALWGIAAVACSPPPGEPDRTVQPVPVPSSDPTQRLPVPPPVGDAGVSAACLVGVNPLRSQCGIAVAEPPTGVEVTFVPIDGSRLPRVHRSLDPVLEHVVDLYFMTADTSYAYTVTRADDGRSVSGSFVTGSLPAKHTELFADGLSSSRFVGSSSACRSPVAVIHDTSGDLVWIQNMTLGETGGYLEGTSFTEDRTVLSIGFMGGGSVLSEVDLAGRSLAFFRERVEFDQPLHHDAFKRDGLIYALSHEIVDLGGSRRVELDGFYIFDEGGLVAEWWLSDRWLPHAQSVPPSANDRNLDFTHANAIWVDERGDVLLSFRKVHTLMKVTGLGPDFGEIEWVAAGGPSPWKGAFDELDVVDLPNERTGFLRQHNVHQLPGGDFAMFDNRGAPSEASRLLVFEVDPEASTLEAREAYDLPLYCDYQGGAWFTAAGNPLATCAPDRTAYEFRRGGTGVGTDAAPTVWEARLDCIGDDGRNFVPRFVPLDW